MIGFSQEGDIVRLVLGRPDVRNALAVADWQELAACCARAAQEGARAIVVSGSAGAFCAGADLREFPQINADAALRTRFRTEMREALTALRDLPVPSLAWIEGACFGAGVALAMACDLRIAAPGARFAITPAKMGIGYPQEDVARLVQLVGAGWAARLLFTAAPVDAAEAERIGLVEGIGSADDADRIASQLAAANPASIAMLKRGIRLAEAGIAQDAEQDRRFDALMASPDLPARLSRAGRSGPLPPKGA